MNCKNLICYLVLLIMSCALISCVHTYPAKIINYKPVEFQETISDCFFYSIGSNLKYSTSVDNNEVTIDSAAFNNYYVSPDNRKMLISSSDSNKALSLITITGCPLEKVSFSQIDIKPPLWFDNIQWSSDSNSFYFMRNKNNAPNYPYIDAKKEMLVKYDLEKKAVENMVEIYPIYDYFIGKNSIYYTTPTKEGDLVLKSYFGGRIYDVKVHSNNEFEYIGIGKMKEEPFFNFSTDNYNYSKIIVNKGIRITGRHKFEDVTKINMFSNNNTKNLLELKKGVYFKGWAVGFDLKYSYFLPGDRYFVVGIESDVFNGNLLIDTKTLQYKELPADVIIYPNYNTINYKHYSIGGAGVKPLGGD